MSKKVYVGRISHRTSQRDIDDLFSRYGYITSIDLKDNFGFVHFESARDAEDAVYYLKGQRLNGERIQVEMAHGPRREAPRNLNRTDYRVIVEGLSERTSWQDLKDHMRKSGGTVVYTEISRDRSKGMGCAEFSDREGMETAIKELDGSEIAGRVIKVREDRDSYKSRSRSRSPRKRRRSASPDRDHHRHHRQRHDDDRRHHHHDNSRRHRDDDRRNNSDDRRNSDDDRRNNDDDRRNNDDDRRNSSDDRRNNDEDRPAKRSPSPPPRRTPPPETDDDHHHRREAKERSSSPEE